MHISVLPKDPRPSGWYAILPEPPPVRRLSGQQKADWVVVGAGFTGVAAARRLAELAPSSRIVLIEAQRAGMGASGRNAGFIIDVPHNADAAGSAMEANQRILRLNRFAIAWLQELVEKHQIRCDWQAAASIAWRPRPPAFAATTRSSGSGRRSTCPTRSCRASRLPNASARPTTRRRSISPAPSS